MQDATFASRPKEPARGVLTVAAAEVSPNSKPMCPSTNERVIMPGKSPQRSNVKKTGKSLKEKRADKRAKKDLKDQQSSSEIVAFRHTH
jgi:hypothetical protein